MILKKELGKKIQQYRKKRGITQEQLADKICIDSKSVSKIENGNIYPSSDTLMSITRELCVEPWELFLFTETKSREKIRQEIIEAIDKDDKILIKLYQTLKLI